MREARKVYKSGRGSYIITLPKKWILDNNIKEGDTVFVEYRNGYVCIRPRKSSQRKETVIDEESAGFDQLMRLIISYYLANYDSIRVKVYNDEQRRAVALTVDILVGAEIMEDTGTEILIEIFLDLGRFKIDNIMEKLYRMTVSMLSDICIALRNLDRSLCGSIMVREGEIDKIHFLVLRLLNSVVEGGTEIGLDEMGAMSYRSVVRALERISDHLAKMAEAIVNLSRPFPELCGIVRKVEEIFRPAMVAFFKRDRDIAETVLQQYEEFESGVRSYYEKLLEFDDVTIMNLKTIIDSLIRVGGYSTDIAEMAINMSVR